MDIGSRCFIGIHSALGLDVRLSDDSALDDQSLLPDGHVIPPGEGRHGSPAQPADVPRPSMDRPVRQSTTRRALFGLAHVVAADLLIVAMLVPGLAFLLGYWFAFSRGGVVVGASAMIASVPAGVAVFAFTSWSQAPGPASVAPGVYPVLSLFYLRKWWSDC